MADPELSVTPRPEWGGRGQGPPEGRVQQVWLRRSAARGGLRLEMEVWASGAQVLGVVQVAQVGVQCGRDKEGPRLRNIQGRFTKPGRSLPLATRIPGRLDGASRLPCARGLRVCRVPSAQRPGEVAGRENRP